METIGIIIGLIPALLFTYYLYMKWQLLNVYERLNANLNEQVQILEADAHQMREIRKLETQMLENRREMVVILEHRVANKESFIANLQITIEAMKSENETLNELLILLQQENKKLANMNERKNKPNLKRN